jgi:peptide subunit release factor 1 (eRF1)
MENQFDLTALSNLSTREKTCLTLYVSSPDSLTDLDKSFDRLKRVLKQDQTEKDERDYFEENVEAVRNYLKKYPLREGSLCIVSCWVLEFFETYKMHGPVKDLIWFDSSPYIRPLAEFMDDFETVAVVVADNKKARIFLITSGVPGPETSIEGNIKNHVRKGGWSQQRYERRRDKELLHYTREIANALSELEKTERFNRVILVGGSEVNQILFKNLPENLKKKTVHKAIDLHKGDQVIHSHIMDLFAEQERQSELDQWEKIRSEFLRGNLGVTGPENVLEAVSSGQADIIIVHRDLIVSGQRCRDCEHLQPGNIGTCSLCGSSSVFSVDLVNEITELAQQTGAEVVFCDTIDTLTAAGGVAALLRYKV